MKFSKVALVGVLCAGLLASCGGRKVVDTGIASQIARISGQLIRSEYTIMNESFTATVQNKKQYRKYTLDELKKVAFMMAEKTAIEKGADSVLNPTFMVDQKRKTYTVTARVKGYRIKSDDEYIDMDQQLKNGATGGN